MIAYFVVAGQSNVDQWFHVDDGAALEAFKASFLALNPEYSDVQFIDAARGGSAMLSGSASAYAADRAPDDPELFDRISQNYWYDEVAGEAGPNLETFTAQLEDAVASGIEVAGIIWAQGEADTTYVGANGIYGADAYAEGLDFVLNALMEASGASQVYIQALGDRSFYSETLHGGADEIRAAQEDVAASSDAITIATTIFDLELRDSVHLTAEDYITAAERMAIAISTGETSPAAAEAILLNGQTILIQLSLADGQSIVDDVTIDSFVITENSADIEISSVSISPEGLLRIETSDAVTNPVISYGSVEQSVDMQPHEFIYATGAHAVVPVLPFVVTASEPRLTTIEVENGIRVDGSYLSEEIIGLSGDDYLFGNAGHDILIGGGGTDRLYGGSGQDTFVMGDDGKVDVVYDFNVGQDAIGLLGFSRDELSFSVYGENDLEIRTHDGQRIVLRNVDINTVDDIRLHTLGTDGANTLQGSSGDDRIFAYAGDDAVDSGGGTDRITVGDGSDVVAFGTGYDTNVVYDFDIAEDSIQLVGISGFEIEFLQYGDSDLELRTPQGDRLVLRNTSLSDVPNLILIDPEPETGTLLGTAQNDVLRGSDLAELINGFAGTDRLFGGGGDDVFVFQEGSDLNVVYDFVIGEDRILVEGGDFDDLTLLSYKGTDAEIRLSTGERLVLRDVDIGTLSEDNFVFTMPDEFL